MGQITISLPDEVEERLRKYAAAQSYSSLSSLVSEAIREKFEESKPLDYWSRVSLVVQLENQRLLEALLNGRKPFIDGEWSRDHDLDALRGGYNREYWNVFQYVDPEEVTPSESKYVIDVLDMYADLQFSAHELKDKELLKKVMFPGFDGNEQTQLMAFAQYLRSVHRFAHVSSSNADLNSHGMGPDYRAMLTRYRSVRSLEKHRVQPLSKDAIVAVLTRMAKDFN